jgi:flagellar assembly protein FliH
MPLSDKVIKATNVKLVGTAAGIPAPHHRAKGGMTDGGTASPGLPGYAHPGDPQLLNERINGLKKEAYEKGFASGMESRKKEVAQLVTAMAEVTRQTAELKKKLYAEAEEQILGLAFSIAEKVIHTEVSTNKNIFAEVLRGAAKSIVDRESIKVRLNPEDFRHMMEIKPDLFQEMSWLKKSTFEEDSTIKPGGVLLETISGEIDARLDQQLKEIQKSFQKR